jgi:hypothetical protein
MVLRRQAKVRPLTQPGGKEYPCPLIVIETIPSAWHPSTKDDRHITTAATEWGGGRKFTHFLLTAHHQTMHQLSVLLLQHV